MLSETKYHSLVYIFIFTPLPFLTICQTIIPIVVSTKVKNIASTIIKGAILLSHSTDEPHLLMLKQQYSHSISLQFP